MKKATNNLPTVDIKGSQYVLVKDRINYFNETFTNGAISTEASRDGNQWCVKATVTPDVSTPTRIFTGYSQAVEGQGMVNKTAALENAETSAVGRALAMMGIGVIDSIASADEMHKAGAGPLPWEAKGSPEHGISDEDVKAIDEVLRGNNPLQVDRKCTVCGESAEERQGISRKGTQYHGIFCSTGDKSHTQWLWD